jgi:hypothetical protein
MNSAASSEDGDEHYRPTPNDEDAFEDLLGSMAMGDDEESDEDLFASMATMGVDGAQSEDDEESDEEENNDGHDEGGDNASVTTGNAGDNPAVPYVWLTQMYSMNRAGCGTSWSTEDGFKPIMPLWAMFCSEVLDRVPFSYDPPGLGLYNTPENNAATDVTEASYDHAVVDKFFNFLVERQESTKTTMSKAKTFLNSHLKCEFYAVKESKGKYGFIPKKLEVGSIGVVGACVKTVNQRTATEGIRNKTDALALVDNMVSDKETRAMLVSAYCPKKGGRVAKMNNLYKLQFPFSYNSASATARRGEISRYGRVAHRFVTQVKGLGPDPGLPVSHFLTNQGKTNKVGRVEYTGAAPHNDALRDVSASLGMLTLYRFFRTAEPLPNFLDYNDFMDIPTLPSLQNPRKAVGAPTFGAHYKDFMMDAGVMVQKVTHQNRGQAQREMDNNGVDPAHTSRMAGHTSADVKQSRAQKQSYLFSPPVPALAQRGGSDPSTPRSHSPSWILVEGEPLEKLMRIPTELRNLLEQQKQVHAKYYACQSYKARKAGRWCSAKACLDSMIHDIHRGFQFLASRPICPDTGVLLADQGTFRSQFKDGVFSELLTLPVFESDEWREFEYLMRVAQDEYFSAEINVPMPVRNELERIMKTGLDDRLIGMERSLHFLMNAIRSSHPVNGSVGLGGRAADGPTVPSPSSGLSSLQPSLPAHEDTLADGLSRRKRRRGIPQQDIVRAEHAAARDQGDDSTYAGTDLMDDRACITLEDYWRRYKGKWLPEEERTGGDWRRDKQISGFNRMNAKATWWGVRAPLFALVNYYIDSAHLSEVDALAEANITFCSVPPATLSDMRPIKNVSSACKAKLVELGVVPARGRPRTKKRRGNDGSAFAAAFEST